MPPLPPTHPIMLLTFRVSRTTTRSPRVCPHVLTAYCSTHVVSLVLQDQSRITPLSPLAAMGAAHPRSWSCLPSLQSIGLAASTHDTLLPLSLTCTCALFLSCVGCFCPVEFCGRVESGTAVSRPMSMSVYCLGRLSVVVLTV